MRHKDLDHRPGYNIQDDGLDIDVYVKPLKDGVPEQAYSVDMRGNIDVSFDRGINSLVRNRMPEGR